MPADYALTLLFSYTEPVVPYKSKMQHSLKASPYADSVACRAGDHLLKWRGDCSSSQDSN